MDEENNKCTQKVQYKKYVNAKVKLAAFKSYIKLSEKSKKKMKYLEYNDFKIQSYMNTSIFTTQEIKLLFSLRSKCYPAKVNFKKLHKGDLKCTFLCNVEETQSHIFQDCEPIKANLDIQLYPKLEDIYKSTLHHKNAVKIFTQIDIMRKQMKDKILPG